YTGEDVLKNDNMTDIWLAAHQLQIDFLIQRCESFIAGKINWANVCDIWQMAYELKKQTLITKCESFLNEKLSLENYYIVYSKARRLEMSHILKNVQEFMIKNFEMISKDVVCKLSFEGVLEIVESHDLVVKSEDGVLDFIFKWIECQPNDTASTRQDELGHTKTEGTGNIKAEEIENTKTQFGKDAHTTDGNNCESDVEPKMLARNFVSRRYDNNVWIQSEGASLISGDSLPLHISGHAGNSSAHIFRSTVSKTSQGPLLSKTRESPMAMQRVDKGDQLVTLLKA
ncbi:unnamed protein product, partial [Lymnaea stagnalis]